jgi:hypothetical protein
MPLTAGSKQIVNQWMKDRCPSVKCPACNGTNLDLGDSEILVCHPKSKPMGTLAGRGPTTEFLPLVCAKCGFALFFSVKVMGLTV